MRAVKRPHFNRKKAVFGAETRATICSLLCEWSVLQFALVIFSLRVASARCARRKRLIFCTHTRCKCGACKFLSKIRFSTHAALVPRFAFMPAVSVFSPTTTPNHTSLCATETPPVIGGSANTRTEHVCDARHHTLKSLQIGTRDTARRENLTL